MNIEDIKSILDAVSSGNVTADAAAEQIKNLSFEDVGYAKIDHGRSTRQGFPEVVFGQGKTREQIVGIFEKLIARSPNVLITRCRLRRRSRPISRRGRGVVLLSMGRMDCRWSYSVLP